MDRNARILGSRLCMSGLIIYVESTFYKDITKIGVLKDTDFKIYRLFFSIAYITGQRIFPVGYEVDRM